MTWRAPLLSGVAGRGAAEWVHGSAISRRFPGRRRWGGGRGRLCTLLMLNCPSKRQPAPPFRGIFMELSMWPTSCLPISSWMSSPTTAGGKERRVTNTQSNRQPPPLGTPSSISSMAQTGRPLQELTVWVPEPQRGSRLAKEEEEVALE